jgi:hypothetical protein
MESERLVIEAVCGGAVALGSFLLSILFNFSPVFTSLRGAGMMTQSLVFTAIPVTIYVISRFYFTTWLTFARRFLDGDKKETLPKAVQGSTGWLWPVVTVVMMYAGAQIALTLFPGMRQVLAEVYAKNMGDLPAMVMKHTTKERSVFFQKGKRIFYLIVAWFVGLTSLELVLRGALYALKAVLRAIALNVYGPAPAPEVGGGDGGGGDDEGSDSGDNGGADAVSDVDDKDE